MEMPVHRISEAKHLNKGPMPTDLTSGVEILDSFTGFIRGQCLLILLVSVGAGALGFTYLRVARSIYTATAIVAVDGYRPLPFQGQSSSSANPESVRDAAKAASQVAIMTMKSEVLASAVVEKLGRVITIGADGRPTNAYRDMPVLGFSSHGHAP
jgi:uncharacterized protein involved in exopolysaccharide biosynthesis